MKRIRSVAPLSIVVPATILALVMVMMAATLVACGSSGDSSGTTTAGDVKTKTYTDSDYGYSFDYPETWKVEDSATSDVTAGGTKDFWNRGPSLWKRFSVRFTGSLPPIGMHHLHLQGDGWTVTTDAPVRVDLGAIGKGYAVDRMLERLAEWDLTDALVHGGASSAAAGGRGPGSRGWPVTLRHPVRKENVLARFALENRALGASGLEKGAHIIDPATGKPAQRVVAAWAAAPQAAEADAFSTAFMIMPAGDMEACLAKHPELGALVVRRSGKGESIFRHGLGGDKEMEHG